MYGPPGQDISKFISEFDILLQVLSKEKSPSYICGDFNITGNLLNYDTHLLTQSYLDLLLSFSFRPLINMPTRITETSCMLIDNIFTNDLSNENFSGILYSDISDHLPVFTLLSSKASQLKTCDSYILKRQFSDKNKSSFLTGILGETWIHTFQTEEPNVSYDNFVYKIQTICNKCFPMRTIKYNGGTSGEKPWLTSSLLNSCKRKNKLYKISLTLKTERLWLSIKHIRTNLITYSEFQRENTIMINLNRLREIWEALGN